MLAILGAVIVIGAMLWSFLPTWDAIMASRLMELKKIQTLRMPITGDKIAIKWMFAAYILLMVAVIIRYLWRLVDVIRNGPPEDHHDQMIADLTGEDAT